MEKCYFCNEEIGNSAELHHPDKEQFPGWTEPAHPECHTRYHSEAGHFKEWGGWTRLKGRPGYDLAVKKWPGFHSMGGKARAKTAQRDCQGRFARREV
jgi:hypothetical protein